jgi:hypothetical protein
MVVRLLAATLLASVAMLIVALVGQGVAGARELARPPERITDRGLASTAAATRDAFAVPGGSVAEQPTFAQAYAAADRQLEQLGLLSTAPLGTVPLLDAQASGRATRPERQEPPGVPGEDGVLIAPQWGYGWGPNLRQRPRDRAQGGAARDPASGDRLAGTRYAAAAAITLADAAGPTRLAQSRPLPPPGDRSRRLEQIQRELAELRQQRTQELGRRRVDEEWAQKAMEYLNREVALLTEYKEIEIFQKLEGLQPQELRRWSKEISRQLDQIELGFGPPPAPGSPDSPTALQDAQVTALQNAYGYIQRQVPIPPDLRLPRQELLGRAASVQARLDATKAQREAELGGKQVTPQRLERYRQLETSVRDLERDLAETQAILRATTPPEAPEEIIDPWAARQQDSSLQPSGTPTRTAAGEGGPTAAPGADSAVEQAGAFVDGGPATPGDTWVVDASLLQEDSSPEDGVSPPDGSPFNNGFMTS